MASERWDEMPLEPALKALMKQTVGIAPCSGRDAWGNRTYGATVNYYGRVVSKRRKVIRTDGTEVVSETTVYLSASGYLSPEDRITLPSGCFPQQPGIIQVIRPTDESGMVHHTEIYC